MCAIKTSSSKKTGQRISDDGAAAVQLESFLSKYAAEIAAGAMQAITEMRTLLPGSVVLVYDNYNALAIGFGPSEKASEAIFSIAVYPKWISLFFLQGASLVDPQKLLQGSGKVARHIVLNAPGTLLRPDVQKLMAQALQSACVPMNTTNEQRVVIKSVSQNQRPRRPPN